jgi:hypothetical protein
MVGFLVFHKGLYNTNKVDTSGQRWVATRTTLSTIELLVLIAVAIVLDLGLIVLGRLSWKPDEANPQVRVFGVYSPFLTWLKYRRLSGTRQPWPWKNLRVRLRLMAAAGPDRAAEVFSRSTIKPITLLIDLGFLLGLALLFGRHLLDLDPNHVLTGNEWDVFAAQDIVLRNALFRHGVFPLWNPYLNYGAPFLGDPFLHTFNLVIGLPVLAWGEVNGMKIALLLSFFIAGAGQYFLGYYLGLSRPARLWAAALFTINGQFAVRFLQGHYNFQPTAAWIPWIFLAALACFKSRRKWPVIVGAAALALMWLSGNPYYVVYTAFALIPIVIIAASRLNLRRFSWRIEQAGLLRFAGMIMLGVLLSGVALLPQLEMSPRLIKVTDPGLAGSQPPHLAIINYLADDVAFADSALLGKLPVREEYYNYIGATPFILMLFVPLAFRSGRRRDLLCLVGALLVMFLWVDAKDSIIDQLYILFPSFANFRYPSRALILGDSLIPLLGAYGLDALLRLIRQAKRRWYLVGRLKWRSTPDEPIRRSVRGAYPWTG